MFTTNPTQFRADRQTSMFKCIQNLKLTGELINVFLRVIKELTKKFNFGTL